MDVCYYYQILDTGILYEKGRKNGKLWRIGERKRLSEEVLFWLDLLDFISLEENGIDCSEKLFDRIEKLCKKYKFPNYERVLENKEEIVNENCNLVSFNDALVYAKGCMDEKMEQEYREYFG